MFFGGLLTEIEDVAQQRWRRINRVDCALLSNLSGYNVRPDGRIGDYPVARGVIFQTELYDALQCQSNALGELTNSFLTPWSYA